MRGLFSKHTVVGMGTGSATTFRSTSGAIVYCSGAAFLFLIALLVCLTSLKVWLSIPILIVGEALIILSPFYIRYEFDNQGITIKNPFSSDRPFISYASVWRIVDTDKAGISNFDGASSDAIQIWYDRGTSHYVCISPVGKMDALNILRSRCPDADFEQVRRG